MRPVFRTLLISLVSLAIALPANAGAPTPVDVSKLLLPEGPVTSVTVDSRLSKAKGEIDVVVRLIDNPLAKTSGDNAKRIGMSLNSNQQRQYIGLLGQRQNALSAQVQGLGGKELARMSKAINAVVYRVDASQIAAIAALPNVLSVRPVGTYELDLSETVPYIGAPAVWNAAPGFDGTGVRVAVLDSGVDYTHKNLGGSGNLAEYDANDPTIIEPGTFPTAKVIGGYDFVGEVWPNGATTPDPDPLDKGTGAGHGTHVSDIIAGRSTDGTHKGVAPGASLYVVKVCSSVSSSCDGVALLQGMEFALDPNGDNSLDDAVDVINMSLGSSYGQREDDLSYASSVAVDFGVIVVVSAGNSADRPYIVGSPSSTPEVISVAQTQVPSAMTYPLIVNAPAIIAGTYKNTESVDWAPIGAGVTGDVVFIGQGCPAGSISPGSPEDTYLANPAGKIALILRGACAASLKVDRAAKAGAIGVLLALNADGDAITFSNGGGDTFVPTLVIIMSYGDMIKARLTAGDVVNVTYSNATGIALVGSVVGSSSRGPSYSYNAIKPDIGAPGASVSAKYGTGDGETAFGGTSGAAPMVSGAAALLVDAFPNRTPAEIKALLMNTADTNIQTNPATQPGVLAPITRIGGGEVRVNKAFTSKTAAWDMKDKTGSLSFGYHALSKKDIFIKLVTVRNYSNTARTYTIQPTFRYANDAASGAVKFETINRLRVGANSSAIFPVVLWVDPSKLPIWNLNGGPDGGDGSMLQGVEFDGYLNIFDATDNVHLAWQILPHRAADVDAESNDVKVNRGSAMVKLDNKKGAVAGGVDVFALTGTSGRIKRQYLPDEGDNFAIVDLRMVGVRQAGAAIQFAINTYGERAHPNYPAEFDVYIDTNRDGTDDFVIYNAEVGGFALSGQNLVHVVNLATGAGGAYYYGDADLNSGNIILTAPLAAMGMTPSTKFDFSVYAFDNYFTGAMTDGITGMTFTPNTPRYMGTVGATDSFAVRAGTKVNLMIDKVPGGATASPSQMGLLLMYRDARSQHEAEAIYVR